VNNRVRTTLRRKPTVFTGKCNLRKLIQSSVLRCIEFPMSRKMPPWSQFGPTTYSRNLPNLHLSSPHGKTPGA